MRKPVFRGFRPGLTQIGLTVKPQKMTRGFKFCTEDGYRLGILDLGRRENVQSML